MVNNHFSVIGRLTRDPELRYTQTGKAICTFDLAVDQRSRKGEEKKADFFRFKAWGKLAEVVAGNKAKGDRVAVQARVHNNNYETKDGEQRYSYDFVVDEILFLDRSNKRSSGRDSRDDDSSEDDAKDKGRGKGKGKSKGRR